MKRSAPATVAELKGGEIVELAMGIVRITGRVSGGRWVRLVEHHDGRWLELSEPVYVRNVTPVVEVLQDQSAYKAQGGEEVDPLQVRAS